MASMRIRDLLKMATLVQTDPDAALRKERHVCVACHYFNRLAGSAFTEAACACCGKLEAYSSTATDTLCLDCARDHTLCKRCGGDINMDTARRNWPESPINPNNS